MTGGIVLTPAQLGFTYRPLYWFGQPSSGSANKVLANNTAYYAPFPCWSPQRFDRISLEVVSAGGAGSVVGLGIYTNVLGAPGALLLGAGTIDGTSATVQEKTGLTLDLGVGVYWLCASATGNATAPTVRSHAGSQFLAFCGHNASNGNYSSAGYFGAGVNPLAATPAATIGDTSVPRVMMRAT